MSQASFGTRMLRNLLGVMGKAPDGGPPTLGQFARNPLAAAGILAPSAAFLGSEVGGPIAGGIRDTLGGGRIGPFAASASARQMAGLEAGREFYAEDLVSQLEKVRQREEIERNMMAVQRTAPHLYNQVMAGRRLPQGSVVLGGQPRQDLMEELASHMGSLPDPDPIFQ